MFINCSSIVIGAYYLNEYMTIVAAVHQFKEAVVVVVVVARISTTQDNVPLNGIKYRRIGVDKSCKTVSGFPLQLRSMEEIKFKREEQRLISTPGFD